MRKKGFKYFIKPTLRFSIAGLLIPGFTAILIVIPQMILTYLGLECSFSWIILWVISFIGLIALPISFLKRLRKAVVEGYDLGTNSIVIFNLIEYTFIQCGFSIFFGSTETLCGSDGQNGLQFVLTAWIGIPILISLSFIFDSIRKRCVYEYWPYRASELE